MITPAEKIAIEAWRNATIAWRRVDAAIAAAEAADAAAVAADAYSAWRRTSDAADDKRIAADAAGKHVLSALDDDEPAVLARMRGYRPFIDQLSAEDRAEFEAYRGHEACGGTVKD